MPQDGQGDASVLTKLFQHNTWANLKLLDFCEPLSEEQLDATAIGCYGSIRETLLHIIEGEVDYVNLANGHVPPLALSIGQLLGFGALKQAARWAGDELLQVAVSARADTIVHVDRPDEPIYEYPLSSFMVQVLNHSAEHRTQIATVITQLGMEPPSMSGWQYMREHGELLEIER